MNSKTLKVGQLETIFINIQHQDLTAYAFNLYIYMPASAGEFITIQDVNSLIGGEIAWNWNQSKGLLMIGLVAKPQENFSIQGGQNIIEINVMPVKPGQVVMTFGLETGIIVSETGDEFPKSEMQLIGLENQIIQANNTQGTLILQIK